MSKKLFDYVIGNPPYNENSIDTSDKPIYNKFMDASYEVADKVELIHPARFLFNAGKTPKAWNNKMLNDRHFKILKYWEDGKKVFENTDIKAGVAISYRDIESNFGAIEVFSKYEEVTDIRRKVQKRMDRSFSEIIYAPESYKFTEALYVDHPEIKEMTTVNKDGKTVPLITQGHDYDLTTNIFEKLMGIVFFEDKPRDVNDSYIQIVGRYQNKRVSMWLKKKYLADHDNLEYWKVILPKSNKSGVFGEALSAPLVASPSTGHNQTFISIGKFESREEANNCVAYIRTKFARAMLSVLKVTQHNPFGTWKYVPLQDFTSRSDIDWSKSIPEIDQQLYKKYGLNETEINFIESHVEEMA